MVLANDLNDFWRYALLASKLNTFFFHFIKFANFAHEWMCIFTRLETANAFDREATKRIVVPDLTATRDANSITQFIAMLRRHTDDNFY